MAPQPVQLRCRIAVGRANVAAIAEGPTVIFTARTRAARPPGRVADSNKLAGIQTARGVAALLVVLYHGTRELVLPQYLGFMGLDNVFGFGHAGVDFFFVLSGFIITYVHYGDIGRPDRLARYAWRRVTRIYPIFWIIAGLEAARALFSPERSIRLEPWHVVQSLLLVPEHTVSLVPVAWTLHHEMLFYLAFACAIINRRLGMLIAVIGVLFVCSGLFAPAHNMWLGFLQSPFHLEFLLGIGSARLLARYDLTRPRLVAAAGAAAFLAFGVMDDLELFYAYGLISKLLFGSAATVVLVGLVSAERQGLIRLGPTGLLIGGASYSLYLIHPMVNGLTARALATLGLMGWLPTVVVVAIIAGMSVAAAVLLHRGVEVPLMAAIRTGFRVRQPARASRS
jgi:peptidoglycan/LPS O-acetylase OafA/YrhL